jgi:hypothetical protein
MANRVAVRYTELSPDGGSFGEVNQTEWAEDTTSAAVFGRKELLMERGLMSASAALQFARPHARLLRAALRAHDSARYSTGRHSSAAGGIRRTVYLDCLGWFARLAWRVYQPPACLFGNTSSQQGSQSLGNSTSFQRVGQSFRTAGSAALPAQMQARLRRYGSPGDAIKVALQRKITAAGSPSGVDLASAIISGASLASEAYPWTVFTFSNPPQLDRGHALLAGFHPHWRHQRLELLPSGGG